MSLEFVFVICDSVSDLLSKVSWQFTKQNCLPEGPRSHLFEMWMEGGGEGGKEQGGRGERERDASLHLWVSVGKQEADICGYLIPNCKTRSAYGSVGKCVFSFYMTPEQALYSVLLLRNSPDLAKLNLDFILVSLPILMTLNNVCFLFHPSLPTLFHASVLI